MTEAKLTTDRALGRFQGTDSTRRSAWQRFVKFKNEMISQTKSASMELRSDKSLITSQSCAQTSLAWRLPSASSKTEEVEMHIKYLIGTAALLVLTMSATASALPPVDEGVRPGSSTKNIDPCYFASEAQLRSLVSMGLGQMFPIKQSNKGEHVTIKDPRLINISCPRLNVSVRNKIQYKKTRGVPQYSTSGILRFGANLVAQLNLRPGAVAPLQASDVRQATACMTGLKVTGLDLKRVPNWLDNTWIKRKLNDNLNGKMCVDITPYVKLYLNQGGSLGSTSAAATHPGPTLKGEPQHSGPRLKAGQTMDSPKPRMPASGQTPRPKIKGFSTPSNPEPIPYECGAKRCYCKKGEDCDDMVAAGKCKEEDLWCDPLTGGRTCTCELKPTTQPK